MDESKLFDMNRQFDEKLIELASLKGENRQFYSRESYAEMIQKVKDSKCKVSHKKPEDYQRLRKYDTMNIGETERLIVPVKEDNVIRLFVYKDEIFRILHETHLALKHGGRNRMVEELNLRYKNITREMIMIYLSLCNICGQKHHAQKGAECNKRWTYVRDYYIRRRGKPNLGTSSQAARKRAQNLTFLDGITQKKRRACLECSHTSQENVSVSEEDENSRLETTEAEPVTLNSFEREASSPEPVTLNSFEPEASIDDIQEPDKKKRKLEVAEERLAILKELAENLRENSTDIKDANENDLFFAAMSKIVQKLPRSVQAQLRMDVANLIGNAEIKALSSTENSTSGIKYDDNFVQL